MKDISGQNNLGISIDSCHPVDFSIPEYELDILTTSKSWDSMKMSVRSPSIILILLEDLLQHIHG